MAAPRIRVLVIGGHPVIRGVVRLACESLEGFELERELSSVGEGMALTPDGFPDLLVLDLDLPDGDGLELLTALRERGYTGRLLVLSDRHDGATVLGALRSDADGYLTKSEGLRGLSEAMERIAAGERVISPELQQLAVAELGRFARRAREGAQAQSVLTPRELEVLALLADGLTMQQIGRRLGISPRTVETHVSKLYRKLDVRSRVQAVSKAASLGLIDLG